MTLMFNINCLCIAGSVAAATENSIIGITCSIPVSDLSTLAVQAPAVENSTPVVKKSTSAGPYAAITTCPINSVECSSSTSVSSHTASPQLLISSYYSLSSTTLSSDTSSLVQSNITRSKVITSLVKSSAVNSKINTSSVQPLGTNGVSSKIISSSVQAIGTNIITSPVQQDVCRSNVIIPPAQLNFTSTCVTTSSIRPVVTSSDKNLPPVLLNIPSSSIIKSSFQSDVTASNASTIANSSIAASVSTTVPHITQFAVSSMMPTVVSSTSKLK